MGGIKLDRATVQDCIEMYENKGFMAILGDGKLLGFRAEIKGKPPAVGREPAQGKTVEQFVYVPIIEGLRGKVNGNIAR